MCESPRLVQDTAKGMAGAHAAHWPFRRPIPDAADHARRPCAVPRCRGDRGALVQAARTRRGARLSRRRHRHRSVLSRPDRRCRQHLPLLGIRRGAAAVRDRPRTAADPSLAAAGAGVRPRRRAGLHQRGGAVGARDDAAPGARGCDRRGLRSVDVVDRLRAADARRAQGAAGPPRPRGVRDPAVPGSVGDPVPGAAADARRRRGGESRRLAVDRRAGGGGGAGGGRVRGPLRAAAGVPRARRHADPGGLHRGRAADRHGHRARHGSGRPVGLARCVPGRCAPGRLRVPPRAAGRYRAVQGAAARPVLHRGRHVGQSQLRRPAAAAGARGGGGAADGEGRDPVRDRPRRGTAERLGGAARLRPAAGR